MLINVILVTRYEMFILYTYNDKQIQNFNAFRYEVLLRFSISVLLFVVNCEIRLGTTTN